MIVCSCNLLTDAAVRQALGKLDPPERVRDVYPALGCTPKCGGCAASINRLLAEAQREREASELASEVASDRRDAA